MNLILIFVGAVLVNNFVMNKFMGLSLIHISSAGRGIPIFPSKGWNDSTLR